MSKFAKPYIKMYKIYEEPTDYFYIQNVSGSSGSIGLNILNSSVSDAYEYSKDKVNWTTRSSISSITVNLDNNEKLYIRSNRGSFSTNAYFHTIVPYMNCAVGGNLATLIDWKNKDGIRTIPDYCFKQLFGYSNQSYFVDFSNLTTGNLTTVGAYSFQRTFDSCYNITITPDFSSLTTIHGYGMSKCFSNCTSLTSISNNFTNIISVDNWGLQECLYNCENLTIGPNLNKITNAGYRSFESFLGNCKKLEEVTAPNISSWDTNNFYYWLYNAGYNVPAGTQKTVYAPTGLTIPTNDYSGIPNGWTRVDY